MKVGICEQDQIIKDFRSKLDDELSTIITDDEIETFIQRAFPKNNITFSRFLKDCASIIVSVLIPKSKTKTGECEFLTVEFFILFDSKEERENILKGMEKTK